MQIEIKRNDNNVSVYFIHDKHKYPLGIKSHNLAITNCMYAIHEFVQSREHFQIINEKVDKESHTSIQLTEDDARKLWKLLGEKGFE